MQGEPIVAHTAYRHEVELEDTPHAYRNAMYLVVGRDDMDMAIDPAGDGTLLEIDLSGLGTVR